jgi:hypothetical protein
MFAKTVSDGVDFLQGAFPLAPGLFINQPIGVFEPSPASYLPGESGAFDDAVNLWLDGRLSIGADRTVGIVPESWFAFHGYDRQVLGLVLPLVSEVAFVADGYPFATAHELGHTFDFNRSSEDYQLYPDGSCCLVEGSPASASGYWVVRRQEEGYATSYMGSDPGILYPPSNGAVPRWTTDANYRALFQQLRSEPNDPEVLLVTGFISRDGDAAFGPMYRMVDGVFSEPPQGDAAIRITDRGGNILVALPFELDFHIALGSSQTTSTVPFAFSVPFPATAFEIQVVSSDQVLVQEIVYAGLLSDAVASLPDVGFTKNPIQRRNALENKVRAFDAILEAGNLAAAANKLDNDIRTSLEQWLVDDYPTQSARQYTKAAILELVDEILERLGS